MSDLCTFVEVEFDELSIREDMESSGFRYIDNLKCYQARSNAHPEYCAKVVQVKITGNGCVDIFYENFDSDWCIETAKKAMEIIIENGKYKERV